MLLFLFLVLGGFSSGGGEGDLPHLPVFWIGCLRFLGVVPFVTSDVR